MHALGRRRASASTLADVGLFSDGTAVKQRRRRDVPPRARAGRRLDRRRHRRRLRRDQGRLRGHAQHPRAGRRARRRRRSSSTSQRTRRSGETYVAITCGANMNFDRLRFVAERAEVGEEREALFAVTIPEERGSFRRFCELIGRARVTEFNYRISDAAGRARLRRHRHRRPRPSRRSSRANFASHGFAALDLTGDELAKEHVRHMVGGRSAARARRAALSLRLPGAAGRADALSLEHAGGLEHQPVPLPQPGRRLRPHPGRHAGAGRRTRGASPTSSTRSPIPAPTRPAIRPIASSSPERAATAIGWAGRPASAGSASAAGRLAGATCAGCMTGAVRLHGPAAPVARRRLVRPGGLSRLRGAWIADCIRVDPAPDGTTACRRPRGRAARPAAARRPSSAARQRRQFEQDAARALRRDRATPVRRPDRLQHRGRCRGAGADGVGAWPACRRRRSAPGPGRPRPGRCSSAAPSRRPAKARRRFRRRLGRRRRALRRAEQPGQVAADGDRTADRRPHRPAPAAGWRSSASAQNTAGGSDERPDHER